MSDLKIVREIATDPLSLMIEADFPGFTPEELFDHFVRPDLLPLWWAQEAATEEREGGSYHLSWPAMEQDLRGVFAVFEPGTRLVFTWAWDHEPNAPVREVAIEFGARDGGAGLRLTHGPYTDVESEQGERMGHLEGWEFFLGRLRDLKGGI
ncbi:MAG: SRPBCC domain-containing protein [bacterium]|nr:SRPBCC domain-containing protein [bacterium]